MGEGRPAHSGGGKPAHSGGGEVSTQWGRGRKDLRSGD